jgi:hypothetical protein
MPRHVGAQPAIVHSLDHPHGFRATAGPLKDFDSLVALLQNDENHFGSALAYLSGDSR